MKEYLINVFMDRTFDAACLMKVGEEEWASQILNRLLSTYPQNNNVINNYYHFYLNLPDSEMFSCRSNYLIEHRDKVKLRYK